MWIVDPSRSGVKLLANAQSVHLAVCFDAKACLLYHEKHFCVCGPRRGLLPSMYVSADARSS